MPIEMIILLSVVTLILIVSIIFYIKAGGTAGQLIDKHIKTSTHNETVRNMIIEREIRNQNDKKR